jgi:hypothetical protein
MANGDDDNYLDPQAGTTYAPDMGSQDPYPPGTSTALGLGQNDPLRQWASQMTPDQLKTFGDLHAQGDFEGAKQHLVDNNVAPPDFHFDQNGAPMYPTDAFGTTRMSSTGNIQTTPAQQVQQAITQAQGTSRGVQAPSISSELGPGESGTNPMVEKAKENWNKANQAQPYPPGQQPGTPPLAKPTGVTSTPAPAPAPAPNTTPSPFDPAEARKRLQQSVPRPAPPPAPAPAPAPEPSKTTTTETTPEGGTKKTTYTAPKKKPPDTAPEDEGNQPAPGQVPTPKPRPKDADKTWMQRTGEGLSDFSKSLEGVKAPPRPPTPNVSVSSVAPRGPLSVNHPQLTQLLGLIGQNPGVAQGLIQRLQGLRGF